MSKQYVLSHQETEWRRGDDIYIGFLLCEGNQRRKFCGESRLLCELIERRRFSNWGGA
jgi:hypothetical protein